jgi:hypothetical protein
MSDKKETSQTGANGDNRGKDIGFFNATPSY